MSKMDFANYELTADLDVHDLAGGLIRTVATAAGYELSETPDAANLGLLIGRVGPDKELQQNIGTVREALGGQATGLIADWIELSGIMQPVERSFMHDTPLPEETDALIWGGGVVNWMLRRAAVAQRFDPERVGRIYLPMGNRVTKPSEHQLVATHARKHGRAPKEYEFARAYLLGGLTLAGFEPKPKVVPVATGDGDAVLRTFFGREPQLLDGTITVAANAPNAIQAAGQLRVAARSVDPHFDSGGDQLFMASDSFPLARHGEPAKTNQNPETALGQLVRNALFLERNRPKAV